MLHSIKPVIQNRFLSLDALRGLAVLLMILSGSIAFGGMLPAWMYHAQVPPPLHKFNPDIPGITWVDWVFPFFLFSMGAAIPIALSLKLKKNSVFSVILETVKRYFLLVFFAIFIFHSRAWVMNSSPTDLENLLSIGCFVLLFFIFSNTNFESVKISTTRKILGLALAIIFLVSYRFNGLPFNLSKSDIIIIVLANMALFGSLIWVFTRNHPWARVGVLPFVLAIFLSAKTSETWTSSFFNWSPIPWAYTFYYLKYLFIIIPGTFAGEWLISSNHKWVPRKTSLQILLIPLLCLLLVVLNTTFLFSRALVLNLVISSLLTVLLYFSAIKFGMPKGLMNMLKTGLFLLFLGLFFESYDGGIKKDPSTYSYYFVCTGMAFLVLVSLMLIEAAGHLKFLISFLAKVGQNPMIAYTAGNLFLLPFLRITNLEMVLNQLNQTAFGGLMRGLVFTMAVALITLFFTKKRIFWKT
jgi:predicted acyltransferase